MYFVYCYCRARYDWIFGSAAFWQSKKPELLYEVRVIMTVFALLPARPSKHDGGIHSGSMSCSGYFPAAVQPLHRSHGRFDQKALPDTRTQT